MNREETLSCPLECEFLQEAHQREKLLPVAAKDVSNQDIEVTEEFLRSREELLLFSVYSLVQATLRTPNAVDTDVAAALEALIRTYRTSESGLVYETRATNLIAAEIQRSFTKSIEDYQKVRTEREGLAQIRNAEILGILVFLHRLSQKNQNGRSRGRAFIDLLVHMTPDARVTEPVSSILL